MEALEGQFWGTFYRGSQRFSGKVNPSGLQWHLIYCVLKIYVFSLLTTYPDFLYSLILCFYGHLQDKLVHILDSTWKMTLKSIILEISEVSQGKSEHWWENIEHCWVEVSTALHLSRCYGELFPFDSAENKSQFQIPRN